MKRFSFLFPLLILLVFICWYIGQLANPTFFTDESYYIGAMRAIANGDWLLRGYGFDKFFLQGWLPALGVLLVGDNSVGYRLAAFVAWGIGIFVWQRLFREVFSQSRNPETNAFFWTASLYLNPFMALYSVSPMAESFLLLFYGIFIRAMLENLRTGKEEQKNHGFLYAALAVATKQNALLWLPNLFFFFDLREWWTEFRLFVRRTAWVWILILLFLLTGPRKLAPLSMALSGIGAGTQTTSFLTFLGTWWGNFIHAGHGLVPLYLIPIFAFLIPPLRDPGFSKRRERTIFLFALLAHVAVLVVARANPFSRYIFILLPQLAILSAYSLQALRIPSPAKLVYGLIGFFCFIPYTAEFMNPTWGRSLAFVQDELPDSATIHSPKSWYLLANEKKGQERISCATDECVNERRIGQPMMKDQWVLKVDDEFNTAHFERTPFVQGLSSAKCQLATKQIELSISTAEVIDRLLGRIRVSGAAEVKKIEMEGTGFQALLKFKKAILGSDELTIRGTLALKPMPFDERGHRRVLWGVRMSSVEAFGKDLTDWLMITWNSSWLELGVLSQSEGPYERFESLRFKGNSLLLEKTEWPCP